MQSPTESNEFNYSQFDLFFKILLDSDNATLDMLSDNKKLEELSRIIEIGKREFYETVSVSELRAHVEAIKEYKLYKKSKEKEPSLLKNIWKKFRNLEPLTTTARFFRLFFGAINLKDGVALYLQAETIKDLEKADNHFSFSSRNNFTEEQEKK